jgi:acetyl-CoA carboxylase alpha subunit
MKELLRLAREVKEKNPEHVHVVDSLINECFKNINENCAEQYEVEKCYESLKQLKNYQHTEKNTKRRKKSKK